MTDRARVWVLGGKATSIPFPRPVSLGAIPDQQRIGLTCDRDRESHGRLAPRRPADLMPWVERIGFLPPGCPPAGMLPLLRHSQ